MTDTRSDSSELEAPTARVYPPSDFYRIYHRQQKVNEQQIGLAARVLDGILTANSFPYVYEGQWAVYLRGYWECKWKLALVVYGDQKRLKHVLMAQSRLAICSPSPPEFSSTFLHVGILVGGTYDPDHSLVTRSPVLAMIAMFGPAGPSILRNRDRIYSIHETTQGFGPFWVAPFFDEVRHWLQLFYERDDTSAVRNDRFGILEFLIGKYECLMPRMSRNIPYFHREKFMRGYALMYIDFPDKVEHMRLLLNFPD